MAGKTSKPMNMTVTALKATRRRIKSSATKRSTILAMLRRPKGASIVDLTRKTGWQAHSVRAALTGLRKRDIEIVRETQGGISRYRVPTV
jgi:predicted ArsR family transcriptional regulator